MNIEIFHVRKATSLTKKKSLTVLHSYPSRTYYVPGSNNMEMSKTQLKLLKGVSSFANRDSYARVC